MIKSRTVLVLGAGASRPFGFPLGSGLKDLVLANYQSDVGHAVHLYNTTRFTRPEVDALTQGLRYSGLTSVDAFLERRPNFIEVGKATMGIELLLADKRKSRVFISYSQKDRVAADQIFAALTDNFKGDIQVWLDIRQIRPGDDVVNQIEAGLNESDYYLLLISENSNSSEWVKREIATAVSLADKNKLAVVPFLLDETEVPFEFRGLLYIDGSKSLVNGIRKLIGFFRSEDEPTRGLKTPPIITKGGDVFASTGRCVFILSEMKRRDLRHQMVKRLTIENVQEVWYDLFETRMQDDTQIQNLGLACVEILARCDRDEMFDTLYEILCRSFPRILQPVTP